MRITVSNITRYAYIYIFIACVLVCAAFSFRYLMIQEPIGDDVFSNYSMAISYYLDEVPDSPGERITTFSQAMDSVKYIYTKWSGRILGYVFLESNGVLPSLIKAIIGAVTFAINVLLIMTLGFGSLKEASKHSFLFAILYLTMYWYRPQAFFQYMWTMISVYEIPLMVCLAFCYTMIRCKHQGSRELIAANALGLIAGASSEICAIMTISILGVIWIKKIATKELKLKSIVYYCGLFAGAGLCILAPGNFHRAGQSHDSELRTLSIFERLIDSIRAHKGVLIPVNQVIRGVLAIILIYAIVSLTLYFIRHGRDGFKRLWLGCYPYVISAFASILVWGIMPGTPMYGLGYWMAIIWILVAKIIRITEFEQGPDKIAFVQGTASLFILLWFGIQNVPWLEDYALVRQERIALIDEAVQVGAEEVLVPRYTETVDENLAVIDYLNGQGMYDTDVYRDYWGLRVKIE